jgi:simple sugar transport system permease protein
MKSRILGSVLIAVVIVLGCAGGVLYLASYFWGLLLIAAAAVLFFVKRAAEDREGAREQVGRFLRNLAIPALGIVIAVIAGGLIMLITGYDPVRAYAAFFYGGFVRNWHISVLNAVPLIFTGLSIAIAFRVGLFNIGAEGQYYVGTMAATWLGISLGLPPIVCIPLIILLSGALAAAYNIFPAFLKVRTGAHEVITTMMFAHIARYLSPIFIRAMGGDPATSTHAYVTDPVLESNWLPMFKSFLPEANYRLHTGIILAIAVALFVHYLLFYTRIGFEIRAVGLNPSAARAQGISIGKNIFIALLLAGFLAGLSGAVQVLGLTHKMFENLDAGYGWNGISVALLAANNPVGVVFTALLWGALDAGGQYMTRTTQTPNSIVEIIKGIILFLIVARYIYIHLGNKMRKRREAREVKRGREAL